MSHIKGGMPGTIPKNIPCPSRRTKVWIKESSRGLSLRRMGGEVGLSPPELKLRELLRDADSDCEIGAWPGDVLPDVDGVS